MVLAGDGGGGGGDGGGWHSWNCRKLTWQVFGEQHGR